MNIGFITPNNHPHPLAPGSQSGCRLPISTAPREHWSSHVKAGAAQWGTPFIITYNRDGLVDNVIIENRTTPYYCEPDENFDKTDAYLAELRHFCRAALGEEDLLVTAVNGA